jgi:hypothetical protein
VLLTVRGNFAVRGAARSGGRGKGAMRHVSVVNPKRACVAFVLAGVAWASREAPADPGYREYTDWVGWARLQPGVETDLASSFDRAGANADYSQYEWPTGLITTNGVATVKTIQGPGAVYRFWMPHLTARRQFAIRMYFDDEATPRIDTSSDTILDGLFGYFGPPLVDTFAGGQVSYEPICFADSLRIEAENKELPLSGWSRDCHYYQYTYKTYPSHVPVASYSGALTPEQQQARTATAELFDNAGQHPAGPSPTAIVVGTSGLAVPGGGCVSVGDLTGPGIIRQLNVRMDAAGDDDLNALRLHVAYDGAAEPAIDVSMADFFGAGNQRAAYKSLPLGTDSPEGFYCYWPMPFRKAVSVELCNTNTNGTVTIDSAAVEYEPGPVTADLCYLHVESFTDYRAPGQSYHPILSVIGRGHYVGNLLYVEQDSASFYVLEGDEIIIVDGVRTLNGTGLEDAYNGGYYYNWVASLAGEPDGVQPSAAVRPLCGILHVSRDEAGAHVRADQYRWQIADRVTFDASIEVKIENFYGPAGAKFTSVAFWYEQPTVPGDADGDGDLDLADFGSLQQCVGQSDENCLALFDDDADGDVDQADVQAFILAFSGPL